MTDPSPPPEMIAARYRVVAEEPSWDWDSQFVLFPHRPARRWVTGYYRWSITARIAQFLWALCCMSPWGAVWIEIRCEPPTEGPYR